MSNATDLFSLGGSKPKLITPLASGTGTYIPTANNARCFVRVQAAGSKGANYASSLGTGGPAGAMVEFWVRVPIAGLAYVVGATGDPGANSKFGTVTAFAGPAANINGVSVVGAPLGDAGNSGQSGMAGGAPGKPPGFTLTSTASTGGSSFYGVGGSPGNPGGPGTGYGSGGGAGNAASAVGGAGTGGYIEIWDYGV